LQSFANNHNKDDKQISYSRQGLPMQGLQTDIGALPLEHSYAMIAVIPFLRPTAHCRLHSRISSFPL